MNSQTKKQGRNPIPVAGALIECRAILSDLDGTLVDSEHCVDYSWEAWAESRKLDIAHVVANCHGRRTVDSVKLLTPDLDLDEEVAYLEDLEVSCTQNLKAIAGAGQLVDSLNRLSLNSHSSNSTSSKTQSGRDNFAVVTSGSLRLATHRLTYVGLPIPSVLITAEKVVEGKPAPEGYLKAAEALGLKPQECVVLEDSPAGIEAARRAGMTVIGVAVKSAAHDISQACYVVHDLTWLSVFPFDVDTFALLVREPQGDEEMHSEAESMHSEE